MKYTLEIVIDRPIDEVVALFDDPENLKHWQPGFVSMKPLQGTPGQPGARTALVYKMGNRTIEMTETIEVRDLPAEFTGTYEAKGVWNRVRNEFNAVSENRTRWISENEFRMSGMMKVLAALMPGMFRKQSMAYLENFKAFAEKGVSKA